MTVDSLPKGKYIVAVSGGVDSVVLLDVLVQQPDIELIVAHFDHGIRKDSSEDRKLVATLSQKYGVTFECAEGELGSDASEERARQARYTFLEHIRKKHAATGLVTAHHQDDALETMVFNVLRGTKRKGMSSLQSTDTTTRPLINHTKDEIIDYARQHNLLWREDSTNSDEKYTRNWIRRKLLPKLSSSQRKELQASHVAAKTRNAILDEVVQQELVELQSEEGLKRKEFILLPYPVACEIMAAWLRQNHVQEIDRKLIDVLVVSAKTLPPGKKVSITKDIFLSIEAHALCLR